MNPPYGVKKLVYGFLIFITGKHDILGVNGKTAFLQKYLVLKAQFSYDWDSKPLIITKDRLPKSTLNMNKVEVSARKFHL